MSTTTISLTHAAQLSMHSRSCRSSFLAPMQSVIGRRSLAGSPPEGEIGWDRVDPELSEGSTTVPGRVSDSAVPTCVCGGNSYRLLLRTAARDDKSQTFSIVECEACGLGRTLPPPDTEQYRSGYAPNTRDGAYAGALSDFWSPAVARYVRDNSTGSSLLDVGCGVGNLVVAASELGFEAEGIDIDRVATEEARRHGRRVRTAAVGEIDGQFDAIVVNHVLEHVEDLPSFLGEVSRLLSEGGRLFVLAPNRKGLIAKLRRGRWMGWVPREHVWHFTPETLVATVRRTSSLSPVSCTSRTVIEGPVGGPKGIVVAALTFLSRRTGSGDQLEAVFTRGRSEQIVKSVS
jgi:2-polyprenyl-3-methyl-5-hydroxy-6-metoxy-1,4-benzoquinol methylase